MEDIKKAIEEEAKKEAWNYGEATVGDPYVKYQADCGFRAGASFATNFILSKWEESERWRKVEEELPENNKDVLVKVTHNEYVHYLVDRYIYHEWQEYYLDGCIIEWQPINK